MRSQCRDATHLVSLSNSALPYSGWKHYVFEGGVRSAVRMLRNTYRHSGRISPLPQAFVTYSKLNNPGSVHDGLFHSVDWLPTLVNLVGGQTSK